jgi:hypothetical protein
VVTSSFQPVNETVLSTPEQLVYIPGGASGNKLLRSRLQVVAF